MMELQEEALEGVLIGVYGCETGRWHGAMQCGGMPMQTSKNHWDSPDEALTWVRSQADQWRAHINDPRGYGNWYDLS